MRTTIILAALALAATGLSVLPTASAYQPPPPCYTMTTCCPVNADFAPCCTVLSCPPPIARCPETRIDTADFIQWLGPSASVATHYDCSVEACVSGSFCCVLDGVLSRCSTLDPPALCLPPQAGAAAVQTAVPVPHVSVVQNEDCSFTVSETVDSCPNGFVKSTIHYTVYAVYPIHLVVDQCVPMCACIPLEAPAAAPEGSA